MLGCEPSQVNGFPVLKANNYDLEEGERSVFDQELNREPSTFRLVLPACSICRARPVSGAADQLWNADAQFALLNPLSSAEGTLHACAGDGGPAQGVLGDPAISHVPRAAQQQQQPHQRRGRRPSAATSGSERPLTPVDAARKAHNDAVHADAQVPPFVRPYTA